MPLVHCGIAKKVVAISSGMGDVDFVNQLELDVAASYAISKAGLNMAVAKYNAIYKGDGILFMGICPGSVDTEGGRAKIGEFHFLNVTKQSRNRFRANLCSAIVVNDEDAKRIGILSEKFMTYAPDFKGPAPPETSAMEVMNVVYNASLQKGSGGSFVSHVGPKRWM